jgi:hypothetical protein
MARLILTTDGHSGVPYGPDTLGRVALVRYD